MTSGQMALYVTGLVACYWGGYKWGWTVHLLKNLGDQA